MKKISFLTKLAKEGKLQVIESSEEINKAYLQRSNESLLSSKALFKIGNLKDAVALGYYSMYHCLQALLFRVGIKCENHSASIMLLKEIFDINNNKISKAKSDRIDKQYYVDFSINQEETNNSIVIAEEFIATINDFLAKLNEKNIKEYREKAISLFVND